MPKEKPETATQQIARNPELEKQIVSALESDVSSSEEAMGKAVMYLAETRDPKILSDLSENEVKLCTALDTVSEKLNDKLLTKTVTNFLYYRVSKKRLGRKEILQISQRIRDEKESKSKLRQLMPWIR